MARATAVIITSDPRFGSECQHAFRHASIFPIVVRRVDRAVNLVREFRADIIVLIHAGTTNSNADDQRTQITEAAGTTPLLEFATPPSPSQLAAAIREAVKGCESGSETAHS